MWEEKNRKEREKFPRQPRFIAGWERTDRRGWLLLRSTSTSSEDAAQGTVDQSRDRNLTASTCPRVYASTRPAHDASLFGRVLSPSRYHFYNFLFAFLSASLWCTILEKILWRMSKLQEILHEKQQETLLYKQLVAVSASLTEQAQRLADSADIMADGGVAVASVMANWGQVFRIINVCDPISNPPPLQDATSSNRPNSHIEADESITNESLTGRSRRRSGNTGEDEEVEPVPMLVRMELETEGVQGE